MAYRRRHFFTDKQKSEIWDRWQRGESMSSIGRGFDRASSSIYPLLARTGGIRYVKFGDDLLLLEQINVAVAPSNGAVSATRAKLLEPDEARRALSHYVKQVNVFGVAPIEVDELESGTLDQVLSPSRGLPPVFGDRSSEMLDGENFVYLMMFSGGADFLLGRSGSHAGHALVKVGRSNDPTRRLSEINAGFPERSTEKWTLANTQRFPDGKTAHQVEDQMKTEFEQSFRSQGGEFFTGDFKTMQSKFQNLGVRKLKEKTGGFTTWEDEHIERFLVHHKPGTRAHLSLMLLLYTGQRRADVVRMGRQHVRNNVLTITQQKTGQQVSIPLHPDLKRVLDSLPNDNLTFLLSDRGGPLKPESFTNWFKRMVQDAGLSGLSAHGLRKATCRMLAESGCTPHQIMAISGHKTLSEVTRYTVAANRKGLAEGAMASLSQIKGET